MLYDLKILINNLNFKFQIFTLLNYHSTNIIFTTPNMLKIAKNITQDSTKLKFKIIDHQSNSLN